MAFMFLGKTKMRRLQELCCATIATTLGPGKAEGRLKVLELPLPPSLQLSVWDYIRRNEREFEEWYTYYRRIYNLPEQSRIWTIIDDVYQHYYEIEFKTENMSHHDRESS
jgi:hypothetical protein